MKKKFLSLVSLMLAVVMITGLSVCVSAASLQLKYCVQAQSSEFPSTNTYQALSGAIEAGTNDKVGLYIQHNSPSCTWVCSDTSVASMATSKSSVQIGGYANTVEHTTITPKKAGTVVVTATSGSQSASVTIEFKDGDNASVQQPDSSSDATQTPVVPTEDFNILHNNSVVSGETIDIFDSGKNNSVALKVPTGYSNVSWSTSNPNVVSVENGVITAKAVSGEEAKTAVIIARYEDPTTFEITTKTCTVRVTHRQIVKVDLTAKKSAYYVGETITKDNLEVKAYYNDAEDTPIVITDYTIVSPTGALKTTDTKVKIKAESVEKEAAITVTAVDVTSLIDKIEIVKPTRTSYTEGDTMEGVYIKVTYKDNTNPSYTITNTGDSATAGITQSPAGGTKLKTTDKTLTVTYEGKTATTALTVAAKSTTTPPGDTTTTTGNTIEYEGTIPTTYEVGDTLDFSKVTKIYLVKNGEKVPYTGSNLTNIVNKLKSALTFDEDDIGENKTVKVKCPIVSGSTSTEYTLTLTGIKVTAPTEDENKDDKNGPKRIVDIELLKDKYDIGYEFDIDDIDVVEVKWNSTSETAYEIDGADLDDYEAKTSLEVLDKNDDEKYSDYDTIEEDDVRTDYRGDEYVMLRFTFGKEDYDFEVEVGSDPIQFIHNNKLLASYKDLEEALDIANETEDDEDLDFDFDKVKSSKPITLKLGEDMELDDDFKFDPDNYIEIDLNGHTLTISGESFKISSKNDNHLVITNSSKNAGKIVYDHLGIEVVVESDETLAIEDEEELPGIYTVEVTWGKNGTVTSKPKMDSKDTIEAGSGTEITFTITPAKNYQLDTIKADGKAVAASAYTKATSGVITYKYKVGEANGKIEVSFKAVKVEKPAWKNPYTDVRSNASYLEAVEFVTENELMNGTSSTTFSPTKTMNRAMFVTVLGRLAGVDTSKYNKSSFIDVPLNSSTSWYAPYVEWANQNGIIQGYGNGKFGPMDEITHQQLYTIVYRYAVFVENIRFTPGTTTITVSDKNDIDSYAIDGVKFATAKDMLVTSGGKITPKSGALRWELATVLQLFCENVLGWEDAE